MDTNTTTKQKRPALCANTGQAKGQLAEGTTKRGAGGPRHYTGGLYSNQLHEGTTHDIERATTAHGPCISLGTDAGNTADVPGTCPGTWRSARVAAAKHSANTATARPTAEQQRPRRRNERARRRAGVSCSVARPACIERKSASLSAWVYGTKFHALDIGEPLIHSNMLAAAALTARGTDGQALGRGGCCGFCSYVANACGGLGSKVQSRPEIGPIQIWPHILWPYRLVGFSAQLRNKVHAQKLLLRTRLAQIAHSSTAPHCIEGLILCGKAVDVR